MSNMASTVVLSSTVQQKLSEMAHYLAKASKLAYELSQSGSADMAQAIPDDQQWFWSEEWQAGEREVDEQIARGEYKEFDSVEALLADLHSHV